MERKKYQDTRTTKGPYKPPFNKQDADKNKSRRPLDQKKQLEYSYRVNDRIRVSSVRLVGDNIEKPGVYPIDVALRMGDDMDLDLVEVSPNSDPPVCKLIDFQKFIYQQRKKQKEIKARTAKVVMKEIRFSPHTDDHDYNFKLKHAENFLKEGAKVKAYVFFKGRTIMHKDQGEELLSRLVKDLEEYGKVEKNPELEGKRMIIYFASKGVKK